MAAASLHCQTGAPPGNETRPDPIPTLSDDWATFYNDFELWPKAADRKLGNKIDNYKGRQE